MKHREKKRAIDMLGPWNQRYKMGKHLYTTDENISGEEVWPDLKTIFDDDLYGARILDVGCGSAYYSVMMALNDAQVISIEPSSLYFKQARWTKYYFEQEYGKELDIQLHNESASEFSYAKNGEFDYILALSVIDFIGEEFGKEAIIEQKKVISKWCDISDKIVVRTKNDKLNNSIAYYNGMFLENEFYMFRKIMRDGPIILYGRLTNSEVYTLEDS